MHMERGTEQGDKLIPSLELYKCFCRDSRLLALSRFGDEGRDHGRAESRTETTTPQPLCVPHKFSVSSVSWHLMLLRAKKYWKLLYQKPRGNDYRGCMQENIRVFTWMPWILGMDTSLTCTGQKVYFLQNVTDHLPTERTISRTLAWRIFPFCTYLQVRE